MTERKERSFLTNAFLWCVPTIGIYFFVGLLFFERTTKSAISFALAMGLFAMIAFGVTDFFSNKTAARVIYVLACIGIIFVYWNGSRP